MTAMRPAITVSLLVVLALAGAADGRTRTESRRRPSAEVYQEAQDHLKSQGMVLDGPQAPKGAGATSEGLVRELVTQLQAKNNRGVLSLLWNTEGVTCSKAEDQARRRVAGECARNLGRLTVSGVASDARLRKMSAVKVEPGARIEGCTAKEATSVEHWQIASRKERHTVIVVQTGVSGWKVVRVEIGDEK
jgi:hypothetical protein